MKIKAVTIEYNSIGIISWNGDSGSPQQLKQILLEFKEVVDKALAELNYRYEIKMHKPFKLTDAIWINPDPKFLPLTQDQKEDLWFNCSDDI